MTVFLHGFWGQPSDWNPVLQRLPLGQQVSVPDLYEPGILAPVTNIKDWPARFWEWAEGEFGTEPLRIVGYSMGARLALHAILGRPERVKQALLLSVNPCLDASQFEERKKWEFHWQQRFLRGEWAELEAEWQEQAVFQASQGQGRRKTQEIREMLALSLESWSIRRHNVSEDQLRALPASVAFAFGADDKKYRSIAKNLQELPVKGQISVIQQSGHRLITDSPDFVCHWLQEQKQGE